VRRVNIPETAIVEVLMTDFIGGIIQTLPLILTGFMFLTLASFFVDLVGTTTRGVVKYLTDERWHAVCETAVKGFEGIFWVLVSLSMIGIVSQGPLFLAIAVAPDGMDGDSLTAHLARLRHRFWEKQGPIADEHGIPDRFTRDRPRHAEPEREAESDGQSETDSSDPLANKPLEQ
jgi:hypothetical protein